MAARLFWTLGRPERAPVQAPDRVSHLYFLDVGALVTVPLNTATPTDLGTKLPYQQTAFTGGIVFGVVAADQAEDATFLAEQTGELLNAVTFLLFGAVLLGPALGELHWRIAAYALGSLTVVRMLPVALAMMGTGMRRVTVGFLGWFGPRGLASIVFVLILLEETALPERPLMLTVVTWTVALSVYAHA